MGSKKLQKKQCHGGRQPIQLIVQSKEVDRRAKNIERQQQYRLNCLHNDLIKEQMEMVQPKLKMD
jgi:hypothetical protein